MINPNNILHVLPALLLLASCNRFEPVDNVFANTAYLDVSATNQTQIATLGNKLQTATKELSVALALPAPQEITATVAVDESLLDDFNSRNGTAYELLPARYLDFTGTEVRIKAGSVTSDKITIGFKNLMGEGEAQTGAMEIDKTYLLPVAVTSDDIETMKGSSIAYYLVKRSSAITLAADLTDNWINFPLLDTPGELADVYNDLTAVTYEALVNINRFDDENDFGPCNISTVMGVEQYLLFRIGDTKFERKQLQFDGSGNGSQFGKVPVKGDPSKTLSEGQWYHVACTYDQNTRVARIYLNGKLLDEAEGVGVTGPDEKNRITLAMQALGMETAYRFCIGWSYNDYRPLQGKIAEARVWSVARTQEQIWDNMYRIENPKEQPELIGYWKFDDGKGNTVTDYSRYGNHGQAQNDLKWPSGIEIPEINK